MLPGWQQNVSMMRQHHNHLPPPPPPPPRPPPYEAFNDALLAKRMRKAVQRRVVDYTSAAVNYLQVRTWQRDERDRTVLQPTSTAVVDMLLPVAYTDNPSTSFAAKFVCTSINKNRCPVYRVVWTPTGRRLITGAQTGEFTLWNGQSFNFEMILQAHDKPVRSMVWTHNENWMVTGDDGGTIKYWQSNMNNVKVNKFSHKESVHDISFSSTDLKFCSCSDDTTVKVWDFARCQEERSLTGHGWDVKCADWHPKKSLIASGGKDNLVKLWDAKSGRELCSFHGHKNMVLSVKWNQNGNWLLTSSKDQIIKLYDIRSMKEMESFRGCQKEVTVLAWHPYHEEYFVSGTTDGSVIHWLVGHDSPQVEITYAHEGSVCDLAWHPTGYLLCSGSDDHTTKFWCRNRPGNTAKDQYTGHNPGLGEHHHNFNHAAGGFPPAAYGSLTPGSFAPGLFHNQGTIPGIGVAVPLNTGGEQRPIIPGLTPREVAPPLPPGPPPSHLMPNQQQNYQQFQPQQQQHFQRQNQQQQQFQQQTGQMQLPSNLQMPLHQHMPQNQMRLQGMQGSGNQMMSAMQQWNVVNMNQTLGGQPTPHISQNAAQFPSGLPNIQGVQNFMFNLQQIGEMPQTTGFTNFQPGMIRGGNMGMPLPPPPPPPQPPLPPSSAPK